MNCCSFNLSTGLRIALDWLLGWVLSTCHCTLDVRWLQTRLNSEWVETVRQRYSLKGADCMRRRKTTRKATHTLASCIYMWVHVFMRTTQSLKQTYIQSVYELAQTGGRNSPAIQSVTEIQLLTRLVSWLSIMKLCTCFSALVSSSLRARTATTSAVHPDPYRIIYTSFACSILISAQYIEWDEKLISLLQ
jgi:hypothetical protein